MGAQEFGSIHIAHNLRLLVLPTMVVQVLAPLIPLGMSLAKAQRNGSDASDGSSGQRLAAHRVRTQSVIDRLTAGGSGAPIAHWSEQHLERMIKHNSAFKAHEDELREAHKAARA